MVHISVILVVHIHLSSLMKFTFLKPHLPSEFSLSAELCVFDILVNCSKKSSYFYSAMFACIACSGSLKDFICNHYTEIAISM